MTVRLQGSTSGYTELDAPAVAGNNNIKLPASNGAAFQIVRNGANAGELEYADKLVLGTAKASTSGTSIDFSSSDGTGIPSWAKRITVMFNGVSTSGSSNYLVQVGSGSLVTTGYLSNAAGVGGGSYIAVSSTLGFIVKNGEEASTNVFCGQMILTTPGSNIWIACHNVSSISATPRPGHGAGSVTLSGALDRIRITANGTDTFDLGSINIMYE
jgi:hypothetical protein